MDYLKSLTKKFKILAKVTARRIKQMKYSKDRIKYMHGGMLRSQTVIKTGSSIYLFKTMKITIKLPYWS